jgi:VanZ family protein
MTLQRFWWALGVVIVGAALWVCLVPARELPAAVEWNDKVSHFAGHGLMALYFTGLVARRSWWKIFVFLLFFGIAIEFAQYYMHAGREGDPRDVVANSIGVLLGLGAARLGLWRWPDWVARVLRLSRRATQ